MPRVETTTRINQTKGIDCTLSVSLWVTTLRDKLPRNDDDGVQLRIDPDEYSPLDAKTTKVCKCYTGGAQDSSFPFHGQEHRMPCSPSMCLPRDITILPKYVTVLGPISERNNGRLDYQTCTTCIPYSNLLPPLAVSYFVTFSGNPGVGNVGFRSLNTRSSLPWKLDHTATGLLLVSATRNTNGSKKKKKARPQKSF